MSVDGRRRTRDPSSRTFGRVERISQRAVAARVTLAVVVGGLAVS
jgi:hypothetical protein